MAQIASEVPSFLAYGPAVELAVDPIQSTACIEVYSKTTISV